MKTACLVALTLCGGAAAAQDQPPPTAIDPADPTLTVDVDLVNVVFTVTDQDGRYITDLRPEDLTVYEDEVPQQITLFQPETNLPLLIGLVIDMSASVRDKLNFEQEAATEFFYSTIERRRDQAMLIAFDDAPRLIQDFTDEPEDLAIAVEKLEAGGTSALYDAISLAIAAKMGAPEGLVRRMLIVISDGADTASRNSLGETLEIAQKNDVSIYAIGTNGTANFGNALQEQGDRALVTLTEETGGRLFSPSKLEELSVNFAEISDDLRFQYALGYRPSNLARDGTYREIRIEPSDGNYRIKARSGYYAPVQEPE